MSTTVELGRMRDQRDAAVAIAERIAYDHAACVDGEWGCCHDEDDLRAGGRDAFFDGEEFQPIPKDCPGKRVLDRHLAAIRAALTDADS